MEASGLSCDPGPRGGAYALFLDVERCVGCEACVVACMDQNDLEVERKEHAWRRVFPLEPETPREPEPRSVAALVFVSLACMHCGDAPCLPACPTGAIGRVAATGAVVVEGERCIGCHSCALACPFGAPRYGPDGRMHKCDLCTTRVEHGLAPACVHTCPTRALRLSPVNDLTDHVQARAAARLARAAAGGGHSSSCPDAGYLRRLPSRTWPP